MNVSCGTELGSSGFHATEPPPVFPCLQKQTWTWLTLHPHSHQTGLDKQVSVTREWREGVRAFLTFQPSFCPFQRQRKKRPEAGGKSHLHRFQPSVFQSRSRRCPCLSEFSFPAVIRLQHGISPFGWSRVFYACSHIPSYPELNHVPFKNVMCTLHEN